MMVKVTETILKDANAYALYRGAETGHDARLLKIVPLNISPHCGG